MTEIPADFTPEDEGREATAGEIQWIEDVSFVTAMNALKGVITPSKEHMVRYNHALQRLMVVAKIHLEAPPRIIKATDYTQMGRQN